MEANKRGALLLKKCDYGKFLKKSTASFPIFKTLTGESARRIFKWAANILSLFTSKSTLKKRGGEGDPFWDGGCYPFYVFIFLKSER
jgi:hypothetical protein